LRYVSGQQKEDSNGEEAIDAQVYAPVLTGQNRGDPDKDHLIASLMRGAKHSAV
jgi:hypothetical protein